MSHLTPQIEAHLATLSPAHAERVRKLLVDPSKHNAPAPKIFSFVSPTASNRRRFRRPRQAAGSGHPPKQSRSAAVKTPCVHEGPVVSWCNATRENAKLRECLHPSGDIDICCRRGTPLHGGQHCGACQLYELRPLPIAPPATLAPPPPPMLPPVSPHLPRTTAIPALADGYTRHLLYHVYPIRGNGRWQWNLDQLRPRLPLFNGRRVVAVLHHPPGGPIPYRPNPGRDPGNWHVQHDLDPPEAVESAIADWDCEVIRVANDPNLREVASFLPLFSAVSHYAGESDVTFYAHAKGVRHRPGHTVERWVPTLYEAMLDYWPLIRGLLAEKPVAGCFKKLGPGWKPDQTISDWHYSGSFFWFRNRDLFTKTDWRRIDSFWSGIEPFLSQHFRDTEAATVFHEGSAARMNLYSGRYWVRTVASEWNKWKQQNSASRFVIG